MALKVNLAQINSAARGNSDLRETLTGIHLALQSLYAQTGTTPLTKVDAKTAAFTPAPRAFAVYGEWGQWELYHLHHYTPECNQARLFTRRSRALRWLTLSPG